MSNKRISNNGPLEFHKGIEDELAKYVLSTAKHSPDSVIEAVDKFCWNNHWMMHVGDKKGEIVDSICQQYKPNIILEIGTYCGYSAIRMGRYLTDSGKLYTIDSSSTNCCKQLINHAGLDDKIICFHGFANNIIPYFTDLIGKVDMVFIDHDKKMYLNDLLLIEKRGLLHKDSVVVADNVIIFKINDYLDHVRNSGLYSSSVNHLSTLEYDDSNLEERIDGIEVSVWKG